MDLKAAEIFYSYNNPVFIRTMLKFLEDKVENYTDDENYTEVKEYYIHLIDSLKHNEKLDEIDYQDIYGGITDLIEEYYDNTGIVYELRWYADDGELIRVSHFGHVDYSEVRMEAEHNMKQMNAVRYEISKKEITNVKLPFTYDEAELTLAIFFLNGEFALKYYDAFVFLVDNKHLKKTEYQILLAHKDFKKIKQIEDLLTKKAKELIQPLLTGEELGLLDSMSYKILESKQTDVKEYYSFKNPAVLRIMSKLSATISYYFENSEEYDDNDREDYKKALKVSERIDKKQPLKPDDIKFIYDEVNLRLFDQFDPEEIIDIKPKEAYLLYAVYFLKGYHYSFFGYLDTLKENPHLNSTDYQVLIAKTNFDQFKKIKNLITPEANKIIGHLVTGTDLGLLENNTLLLERTQEDVNNFYSFKNPAVLDIVVLIYDSLRMELETSLSYADNRSASNDLNYVLKVFSHINNNKKLNSKEINFLYDQINTYLFEVCDPADIIELKKREAHLLYAVFYLYGYPYKFYNYFDKIEDNPHINSTDYQILLAKTRPEQLKKIKHLVTDEARKKIGYVMTGLDLGLLESDYKVIPFTKMFENNDKTYENILTKEEKDIIESCFSRYVAIIKNHENNKTLPPEMCANLISVYANVKDLFFKKSLTYIDLQSMTGLLFHFLKQGAMFMDECKKILKKLLIIGLYLEDDEFMDKIGDTLYEPDFQKEFLKTNPQRFKELIDTGTYINPEVKDQFPDLFSANDLNLL